MAAGGGPVSSTARPGAFGGRPWPASIPSQASVLGLLARRALRDGPSRWRPAFSWSPGPQGWAVVADGGFRRLAACLDPRGVGRPPSRPRSGARAYGCRRDDPRYTVLCASYSGNTEETLAATRRRPRGGFTGWWPPPGAAAARPGRASPSDPAAGRVSIPGRRLVHDGGPLEFAGPPVSGVPVPLLTSGSTWRLPRPSTITEWGPDAPEDSLAKLVARVCWGTSPVIAGRPDVARSPIAGDPSQQTRSIRRSPVSFPSLESTNEASRLDGAGEVAVRRPCSGTDSTAPPGQCPVELTDSSFASNAGRFRI